ncbi:MAG: type II secretion system protein GspL [Beggiatoa sp. IS2]|nr:MAG: type II secretion system protein GspL [Beggiatoa sp. IS2]
MRSFLLIYLQTDNQVSWATYEPTGQLLTSQTNVPLETVPQQYHSVTVLLPSTEVVLTQADVPSRQRQRIIQAIPYALEEQFAEEVEKLHFAIGGRDAESGNIVVAVTARARLEAHLQRLKSVGIIPTVILPTVLAVPKPSDSWGITYFDGVALVRTRLQAGLAIETSGLATALSIAFAEAGIHTPKQLVVFNDTSAPVDLTTLQTLNIPIIEKTHEQGILAWFAQGLIETSPLNLLQGTYRPVNKMTILWRPWRLTLALLALWAGLAIGKQWLEYHHLERYHQVLTVQIEKIYRDTFPEARKIVNPRVQMEQQLKILRTQQGHTATEAHFLALFTQISTPLQQSAGLVLKRFDYQQGRFDILLDIANLQALDQLKQRLSALGLSVEIVSANARDALVESRLRVQKK